jgi:hypothetical protein
MGTTYQVEIEKTNTQVIAYVSSNGKYLLALPFASLADAVRGITERYGQVLTVSI